MDTLFTLFSEYGPIPRLLFQYFLPPDRYSAEVIQDGRGEVVELLGNRISRCDRVLQGKIRALLKKEPDIALSTEKYGARPDIPQERLQIPQECRSGVAPFGLCRTGTKVR